MWKKIKKILAKEGGHCIIIEDNQPAYLVKKLNDIEENTEEVNRNIEEWRENNKEAENKEPEEVKVEDLPF